MSTRWFQRTPIAIGAALALLGVVVGIGLGAIPGPGGVITGCIAPSGTLRVIDTALESCKANERTVTWSVTGPARATGATGATGLPARRASTAPRARRGRAVLRHCRPTSGGDGVLTNGNVVSVARPGPGQYAVDFGTPLEGCVVTLSTGPIPRAAALPATQVWATVDHMIGSQVGVVLQAFDDVNDTFSQADNDFNVVVNC